MFVDSRDVKLEVTSMACLERFWMFLIDALEWLWDGFEDDFKLYTSLAWLSLAMLFLPGRPVAAPPSGG